MKASHANLEEVPLTQLLIGVFRLNGALLAAGDRLVGDLGLTSARWQVIGVVATSPVPLPVASIARNMGFSRQGVQSVANDLAAVGLVRFSPNPHHRKAHLVILTPAGKSVYRAAMARQIPWAEALAHGLNQKRIDDATRLLHVILQRLDKNAADTSENTV